MSIPFAVAYEAIGHGGQAMEYYRSLYDYCTLLPPFSLVVEIGFWRGFSATIMASALQGTGSHIISIDPIFVMGRKLELEPEPRLWEYSASETFNRIAQLGLDGYISCVPDFSEKVLERWDGRQIDFLYVDGDHTKEAVSKDCQWMQYVKPGGYSAFDDWSYPSVKEAVNEYVGEHPEWNFLHQNADSVNASLDPQILWDVTILRKKDNGS